MKLIESFRHPQTQSTLLSLPAEIRKMIWQYVRSERIDYEYGYRHPFCDGWNGDGGTMCDSGINCSMVEYYLQTFDAPNGSYDGLLRACQLTYAEVSPLINPTVIAVKSKHLNDMLDRNESEGPETTHAFEICLDGDSIPGILLFDLDNVQTQVATALLELRRQYTYAAFEAVVWLYRATDVTGTRHFRKFSFKYTVHVGRYRPETLGGKGCIERPLRYKAATLGRERACLEAGGLSLERLGLLLDAKQDTPEEGVEV